MSRTFQRNSFTNLLIFSDPVTIDVTAGDGLLLGVSNFLTFQENRSIAG